MFSRRKEVEQRRSRTTQSRTTAEVVEQRKNSFP